MGPDATTEGPGPIVEEATPEDDALDALWALDLDRADDALDLAGPWEDPLEREARERTIRLAVDWIVVVACSLFVFLNLHPEHIVSSAVPAGGDMGAHVWGPAYLRDHLLPEGRLSGWTPDWYAGFPAYQFYMVVPSLLIVALDVGLLGGWAMVIPLLAAAALVIAATLAGASRRRWALVAAAVLVVLVGAELPYGTAFKLVTVLGAVTLPLCAYAFGRLADLRFPGPALLAVAAVLFLFDRNYTIYGGNIPSTLAGEFAFSISLSLALLYLGVVTRGLRTGQHRALAAVLLALTGLCHLIPAFFALGATAVIALLRRPEMRTLTWVAGVGAGGGLLGAFWVIPFWYQADFVNDMGWEKLPNATAENGYRALSKTLLTFDAGETYWKYLIPRTAVGSANDLRWVLALACVGVVLSIAFRVRLGRILAALVVGLAVAFVVLPQARLWNARLLPFYYLCLYFLAAIAVAELSRTIAALTARDPVRPSVWTDVAAAGAGLVVGLVAVALPLRTLPLGVERSDGSYSWLGFTNGTNEKSFVRSWAHWNYSGYEGKGAYGEYRDLMLAMAQVGEDHGCGRTFWEYEKEIDRYGTPMALMLLPHWTDGCIGSMEGLFFESSATTPFHFLTQVELSAKPSAAQRKLPYSGFDLDTGVRHLQLLGVRYYMTTSAQATTAARAHPDLTELTTSGPWVVFQVADSNLVVPLENEPAVLQGVGDAQDDWLCRSEDDAGKCAGPAVAWYKDLERHDVFLASSGEPAWQRVDADGPAPIARPEPPVEVSGLAVGRDRIAFDVDRPGTPVLVKASYFPNWQAQGANGPYRVAPNLMVVVPTTGHVELSFGREPIEWIAYALSALGVLLVGVLATRPALPGRRRPQDASAPELAEERSPKHLAR